MTMRWCRFITLAAVVLPGALFGQAVPTRTIGGRPSVLPDGFTQIASVHELSDGRVLVADARDRLLRIADFRTGTVSPLGRQGQGPNEYQNIGPISRIADTLMMVDFAARRALLIGANGSLLGTRTLEISEDGLPTGADAADRILGGPRFIDERGGIYLEALRLETGKGVLPEGAFIVRFDPAAKKATRAAPFQPWYPALSTRWRAPYMAGDVWAVAPDGRIARIVPERYHVEWYRNGALVARGPEIAVEAIRVTAADRQAWYASRPTRGSGARVQGPTPAETPPSPSSAPRRAPIGEADFPRNFPPFVEEYIGHAALIAPDGQLWVQRAAGKSASASFADVFDSTGKLVMRVRFPGQRRIAAVGSNDLYLVRVDEDGLQWLERYPWRD